MTDLKEQHGNILAEALVLAEVTNDIGDPVISPAAFDWLEGELRKIAPNHPYFDLKRKNMIHNPSGCQ
jgi:hypothetical protein